MSESMRGTVVSSSNGAGGNEGKFLSCFDEHCSCLFTILLKFVLCHPAFDIVMCHQVFDVRIIAS